MKSAEREMRMSQSEYGIIRIVTPAAIPVEKLEALARRFAARAKVVHYSLKSEIDPSLLGGLVIYVGGFRYDYSVKGRLGRIAAKLKDAKTTEGENKTADEIVKLINETLTGALTEFDENSMALSDTDSIGQSDVEYKFEDISEDTIVGDLFKRFSGYATDVAIDEIGTVVSVGDGVAMVSGIANCKSNELLMFTTAIYGIAMNLHYDKVAVVILGESRSVHEGMVCKRTGRTIDIPVGTGLLGRVVDPLGFPVDGQGPLSYSNRRHIESDAPSIIERQQVNVSLHTGITAIDAIVPIGRGQRELIIGDRQTGKTAIAIDTIINQNGKNVYCVYVAIGQKMSTVVSVVNTLRKHNAMKYTTVVVASAGSSASYQYIAPYSGCAIAEELMYTEHADVLIIYDDLTKHAQAYRAISLLIKRPPGREAYPGDVFYLHSRLLERAARLSDDKGGGSITAIPIVETQGGDISAYIPTNVISITDGQIYLETQLFFSGQRPAINVGLSVSRVGGSAQSNAMKKVGGSLRINLAQYRELEAFSQFGSDLDETTRAQLTKGRNLYEILKQQQYSPLPLEAQVISLYLANTNKFFCFDREDIKPFLKLFMDYMQSIHPQAIQTIKETGEFTDEVQKAVRSAFGEYFQLWKSQHEDYGTDL
jgi:F-type H+/Na+-transporting ATPase subunit alpha